MMAAAALEWTILLYFFFAVVGAAVGSFLNVCIWRLPRETSIVRPASHCPRCLHPIRACDNIPVVSFLLLRGKCRDCGERISIRYPAVEIVTAAMALLILWRFGFTLQALFAFLFACALIVITFIDLDHQIIPDVITLPGIPIFFLIAVFAMGLSFTDALFGLLIGGGCLYAVALGYELIAKREGMGGGDIKLLAMIGAFLGWRSLLFVLLASSLLGAIVGIAIMIAKGRDMKYAVPFGPFLSAAAAAYLFVGDWTMRLFFSLRPY